VPDLAHLRLKPAYRKGDDNIAAEFYLPCMGASTRYDRAVGFFNSTVYIIAWPSLRDFVRRGGRIRVICSPVLLPDDVEALADGYAERIGDHVASHLRDEAARLLQDPFMQKPAKVLASLVAMGVIDLRVAIVGSPGTHRLFHDKVGIFGDPSGNLVVFKGSMNETWAGLSADGNLESVDVFVSWEGQREAARIEEETQYFERLWENRYPDLTVLPFPEVARAELVKAADPAGWARLVDEICSEIEAAARVPGSQPAPSQRTLRAHQVTALEHWKAMGRRGILEHATGSGKTFTAICAMRESLSLGEVALVLVPSEVLLSQWHYEIRRSLSDLQPQILLCGAGNVRWREEALLGPWTRNRDGARPRVVLSTMQTACTAAFRERLCEGDHILVVADEVHRLGSPENQTILAIRSGPRLGLSATPRRAGDPEGTLAVFSYFGGVVQPPFTLGDAISAGILTPYFYYVHPLALSPNEQERWDVLTAEIGQLFARSRGGDTPDKDLEARVRLKLIRRAAIVKAASGKLPLAAAVVREHYRPGQRWLVYCDSLSQLRGVHAALAREGFSPTEYHSGMAGDRLSTLRHFEMNGGLLTSIRCLDEGVDIPNATHALILASSQNPREFIQRRGRILRRSAGKTLAHLHDAMVVPRAACSEPPGAAILESEMARVIEFGKTALNPSALVDLERIAAAFGIDRAKYFGGGMEDAESSE
jgi:superfamily II DNA or RNA helicase